MCAEMRVIMELKITDLKKTYGNVKALKGINYTFTPGVYGILGANGAGKSTMINLITDNVSRDKNSGSIMYSDGEDNTVSKELVDILKLGAKFRGVVGYMPQQQGFYEDFSPKAFLRYMAEIKGIKGKNENGQTVKEQIDELMQQYANEEIDGDTYAQKMMELTTSAQNDND